MDAALETDKSPHEPRSTGVRLPELLAPAGDWECARAAVENGADAIYFGLERFNARMRAHNFTEADLPRLMQFLHRRGVKGYVTFNTLVFQNEWPEAEQYVRTMIAAGVDAAIVQDVGICRLIREISPDFPIHVSTQMTITSAAGVEFARELGCNLVVLARECSLAEIEKIQSAQSGPRSQDAVEVGRDPERGWPQPQQRTNAGSAHELHNGVLRSGRPADQWLPGPGQNQQPATFNSQPSLPLEVFVHGALCVAYSGQCLTSEALGGRSANRGECAQACRMPYDLISDGKQVPLGDKKYLLSPQDLAGLEILPDLARAGVASLKIEGRLKSPEYVANITRIYREALNKLAGCATAPNLPSPEDNSHYEMEMAFSRGLYTGWFRGINNQELVHARFGKKRGVYLGEVTRVQGERVHVRLEALLKPGDGIVFDAGHPEEKEEGARVYGIAAAREHGASILNFGHGDIDFRRVHAGDKIWKTSDPELDQRLAKTFEGEIPRFQRPISFEVHGICGKPLSIIARDELGNLASTRSVMPLSPAEKQPLSTERLREQLGRLGGTAYRLGDLRNQLEGSVLLPVSELNRLRREIVQELDTLRAKPPRWTLNSGKEIRGALERKACSVGMEGEPELIVLVRNLAQLEAALVAKVETIYCEFEDPKKYRDAVALFRNSALRAAASALFVAPPRIFKMGEEWTLKQVRSSEADGYLVRNYDHLKYFTGQRCIGDFSLNIANHYAADYFKNRFNLERVTASYDLNFNQLEALLKASTPAWYEVTIHQHIPMFHMEHCVFCAFLSDGTDYRNCGRPCDTHDLKLRDRVGSEHPVKADVGCRNTVFNALAQTGAEYVPAMIDLGVRSFRLEFLNEPAEVVSRTVQKYRALLRREITGSQLWRELKLLNQLGVTRGQISGRA